MAGGQAIGHWLKAALAVSIAITAILAWRLSAEAASNRSLLKRVAQLEAEVAHSAKSELAAQKEKCTGQAEKVFHQLGYDENGPGPGSESLQSHYQPVLDK